MTRYVRRRYLAMKLDCAEPLEYSMVSDAIWKSVLRLFGEVGASQTGLYLIHFDKAANYGVLRCNHKTLPMVRASLAMITKIGEKPVAFHVLRVSGTLKALSRKVSARKRDVG